MTAGNQALTVNGFRPEGQTVVTDNHLTTHGSDWYWAVTAVMMVATFAFMGLSFTKPRQQRIFHYITAAITMVAAIAYFSMASNLGWTGIHVEFERSNPKVSGNVRQIFYVRYIDWVITTPLLLLDLLLTCALPTPTIAYTILINEIMVVTGLVGALVKSSYKWGYYTFGCVAFLFVAYTVVFEGRTHARLIGADVSKVYTLCGVWTIGLWFMYPIAWGLCEGGNVISSDSEAVFYGVLDILAKPCFGALLLFGHRNIDLSRLGLHIETPSESGMPSGEKRAANADANTTGTTTGYQNGSTPVHNTATTTV